MSSASGADDVRAGLTSELRCHRTDYAGRTVHQDALPRLETAVLEQPPATRSGPTSRRSRRREVDTARQRREIARLDDHILRQRAVANPVREAEQSLSHRQARRSIAESGHQFGQLMAGDRRCSVAPEAVGPGRS